MVYFDGGDDIITPLTKILKTVNVEAETERRYNLLLSCCRFTRYISRGLQQPVEAKVKTN
jgi:hypothetical protein